MSPLDGDLLRLLSHMPLLDRMEMAALSGWSGGGVYRAVSRLEDAGLIASVPHGTELIPPTRRFHLTAAGLRRLARAENAAPESGTGQALEGLLRDLPVSARWRRVLLKRLDAVAVVYRIAAAISNTAFPVRFQWYRAMPMDAAVTLPGGGTIAIVRQGPTTDRTGFSKRLWRLTQGPQPGCILVLAPDEVRLRHSRRRLSRTPAEALFALEREAAAASPDAPVWRLRSVSAAVSLRAAIDRMDRRGALPTERPLTRGASLPPDIDEHGSGGDVPDYLLPALLRPAEKRALDLLYDWPWLARSDLAGLLGVSRPRVSQLTAALEGFVCVVARRVPWTPSIIQPAKALAQRPGFRANPKPQSDGGQGQENVDQREAQHTHHQQSRAIGQGRPPRSCSSTPGAATATATPRTSSSRSAPLPSSLTTAE